MIGESWILHVTKIKMKFEKGPKIGQEVTSILENRFKYDIIWNVEIWPFKRKLYSKKYRTRNYIAISPKWTTKTRPRKEHSESRINRVSNPPPPPIIKLSHLNYHKDQWKYHIWFIFYTFVFQKYFIMSYIFE